MALDELHPLASLVCFLAASLTAAFTADPILTLFSLAGAITVSVICRSVSRRSVLWLIFIFLTFSLINPFFSHNGATVLFVVSDRPVTLESLCYGVCSGATVVSVILWFSAFSKIMRSDKLLCVFGVFSAKTALILSMTLRFIPMFVRQFAKIKDAMRVTGEYRDDTFFDKLRSSLRVFSVMVTWALENGIVTAESMEARGYGIGRRTYYSDFRFRKKDLIFLLLSLIFPAVTVCGLACGALNFTFYPVIAFSEPSPLSVAAYLSYFFSAALPTIYETWYMIQWKLLKSKI